MAIAVESVRLVRLRGRASMSRVAVAVRLAASEPSDAVRVPFRLQGSVGEDLFIQVVGMLSAEGPGNHGAGHAGRHED